MVLIVVNISLKEPSFRRTNFIYKMCKVFTKLVLLTLLLNVVTAYFSSKIKMPFRIAETEDDHDHDHGKVEI